MGNGARAARPRVCGRHVRLLRRGVAVARTRCSKGAIAFASVETTHARRASPPLLAAAAAALGTAAAIAADA